jgi:predicted acetyltransferase
MIFLSEPAPQYKDSFLEGLREFQEEGRMLNYDSQRIQKDFNSFLRHIQIQKDRNKISPHLVPTTEYWLIEGDGHSGIYLGTFSLRHELNDMFMRVGGHIGYQIRPSQRLRGYGKELLRLGLQKANQFGFTRVLVTCDETNISSQKVIEYNGGQFENRICVEGSSEQKLRYWIYLQ